MQDFYLPLYNYENKFCEKVEIEDNLIDAAITISLSKFP